jgi:diguanylate cyclase (GGDEF)-like protein/PAS domain S-box-containing protein
MTTPLLRQQAEAKWQALVKRSAAIAAGDVPAALHELGVHQIELEMQNEELLRFQELADQSRARYQNLYDFAPAGYCTLNEAGSIVQANLTLATLLQTPRSTLLSRPFTDFILPEDQDSFYLMRKHYQADTQAGTVPACELHMLRVDGTPFWAQLTASNRADAGEAVESNLVILDIGARKHQEQLLHESQERWQFAIDGCGDALWDWNIQTGSVFSSPRLKELLGYTEASFGDSTTQWSSFLHRDDKLKVEAELKLLMDGACGPRATEFRLRCKDGRYLWMLGRGMVVRRDGDGDGDGDGKALRIIGTISDISERKAHETQLEHMAHFDALTNLPNRVLFIDRLSQALAQSARHGSALAVLFLDLDGFKAINDTHGHEVGDQVLITLALRLREAIREIDTLGRIGGDEFVAVLTEVANPQACLPLLCRMLDAAAKPIRISDELVVEVSASIGVTFYPQGQHLAPEQLLRQADQAMYQVKLSGKNSYQFFDAARDTHTRARNVSLERIRMALVRGEFVLHYQPKVNMRSGEVIGVEALIRWQHPERGLLHPAEFLPDIEDHALSVDVGEWVINTALAQLAAWHVDRPDLTISVNIGARQLQQDNFMERLQSILAQHPQVTHNSLEFEVLETSALADIVKVSEVIAECALLGVKFALDDFGTGYSSLIYLKRLRAALLKIDQSFVRDMLDDPDDLAILRGVIGLASAFNIEVIAEGVETVAHGTQLLQLDCELAQGYGIALPMPAEQFCTWAATWQPDAAWRELAKG